MPGSTSYDPIAASLDVSAMPIAVYRYDPDTSGADRYAPLPNVWCERIEFREFEVPAARLRYVFDDGADDGRPTRFEQVMDLAASGPLVLAPDDRIAVFGFRPDGSRVALFDGFCAMPQMDYGDGEGVTITASGTPVRCYDTPIAGSIWRSSGGGGTFTGPFVLTGLPARLNPDGRACMVPLAAEDAEPNGPAAYPTFASALENPKDDPAISRPATLGMAVRYILYGGRGVGGWIDPQWVAIPIVADRDFQAFAPTGPAVDPSMPATYTLVDILPGEMDLTGMAWPDALHRLIAPFGFAFRFALSTSSGGDPAWGLEFYRKDAVTHALDLMLQEAGSALDPSQSNVGTVRMARDGQGIANRIAIDTEPVLYEGSFILAPVGWQPAAGDETRAVRDRYKSDTPGFDESAYRDTYRVYGFDEIGEGHWDFTGAAEAVNPGDFSPLFGGAGGFGGLAGGAPTFVLRPRPGRNFVFAEGPDGKPRKAMLEISTDYYTKNADKYGSSAAPKVETAAKADAPDPATWQPVVKGWHILKDRLGIRIAASDLTRWEIGERQAGMPFPTGVVDAIKQQAKADLPRFALRLTCVVESDQGIAALADKRPASPTKFPVTRRVDTRDRFGKNVISSTSVNATGPDDVTFAGNEGDAIQYAESIRRRTEAAPFAGSVTVPWITAAYGVGQVVSRVFGRGMSLRGNAASEQGEADLPAVVVGVAWGFAGGRSTTLEIGDGRAAGSRGEP